jgi:hypothetical protein
MIPSKPLDTPDSPLLPKTPPSNQRTNAGRPSRPRLHGSWHRRGERATRTAALPRVSQLGGMEKSLKDAALFQVRPGLSK